MNNDYNKRRNSSMNFLDKVVSIEKKNERKQSFKSEKNDKKLLDESSDDKENMEEDETKRVIQQPRMKFKARNYMERIVESINKNGNKNINDDLLKQHFVKLGFIEQYMTYKKLKRNDSKRRKKKYSQDDILKLRSQNSFIVSLKSNVNKNIIKSYDNDNNVNDTFFNDKIKKEITKKMNEHFSKRTKDDINRIKEENSYKKFLVDHNNTKLHFKGSLYYSNNVLNDSIVNSNNKQFPNINNNNSNVLKYNNSSNVKNIKNEYGLKDDSEEIIEYMNLNTKQKTYKNTHSYKRNTTSLINKLEKLEEIKKQFKRNMSKRSVFSNEDINTINEQLEINNNNSSVNPFLSSFNKLMSNVNSEKFNLLKSELCIEIPLDSNKNYNNGRKRHVLFPSDITKNDLDNKEIILSNGEKVKLDDLAYLSKKVLKNCNYINEKNKNNNKYLAMGEGKLSCTNGMTINEFSRTYNFD